MRIAIRGRLGAALATLVLGSAVGFARPARAADDAAAIVDRFVKMLGEKRIDAALQPMKDEVLDTVAADPAQTVRLAQEVFDHCLEQMSEREQASVALATVAVQITTKATAACPADQPPADDRARAHVYARLAAAVAARSLRDVVKPAQWAEPLADLRRIAATHAEGEADLVRCVDGVLRAADDEAPDDAALRAAAETAAAGVKAFPQSARLQDLALKADIALACAISVLKPADAKAPLQKVLAALAASPGLETDKEKLELYNRCVSEAKRVGGSGKFEFKFETQRSPNGWFEFDWPKYSGWRKDEMDGERDIFRLVRGAPRSGYALKMEHYRHDTNYKVDDVHSIGGENKSGMAKYDHDHYILPMFTKVAKDDRNAKGKLSSRYTETNGFEIRGTDKDGDSLRVRAWYFFGKVNKHTMVLTLFQVGSVKERDPQIEFVLESLREPGGK
jgi:hypothetical protein